MSKLVAETSVKMLPGQMVDLLARVVDQAGEVLAASAFSAITLMIFNRRDLSTAIPLSGGPATAISIPTSMVTGALATTDGWTEDEKGHNFSYSYNSGSDLTGGNKYVIDVKMTTSALGIIHILVNLDVGRVYQ